jgi:hypothetical protein
MPFHLCTWLGCCSYGGIPKALLGGYAWSLAFVWFTVMATLGTGGHYFVDLVVAFPFALMVQALVHVSFAIQTRPAAGSIFVWYICEPCLDGAGQLRYFLVLDFPYDPVDHGGGHNFPLELVDRSAAECVVER